MATKRTPKPHDDPGLQQIDALERLIAEGHPKVILDSGASEAEVEQARTAAQALAASIAERLREAYRARMSL